MAWRATYDDEQVADLRERLRRTRWVDEPATDVDLGVDLGRLRRLVGQRRDGFDFDAHRDRLAALSSYRVEVDGLGVHVLHQRSGHDDAVPLLLAHGWPDSGWRYRSVLPLLTARSRPGEPVFDVVVPDAPGYGFSERATGDIPDHRRVAAMWAELMTRLGYDRFAVAGGDIGSHVARYLALDHPDRVLWVHRMDAGLPVPGMDPATLTETERGWLDGVAAWQAREGAYAALHATKPQTLSAGLTDSPVGTAAWVLEKLVAWSDGFPYSDGDVLDLLTECWMTGTIGSSVRAYLANAAVPVEQRQRYVETPSGFSVFAGDIVPAPRAWVERGANTVYFAEPRRGGHFAPREQPQSYADEVRALARRVEDLS